MLACGSARGIFLRSLFKGSHSISASEVLARPSDCEHGCRKMVVHLLKIIYINQSFPENSQREWLNFQIYFHPFRKKIQQNKQEKGIVVE